MDKDQKLQELEAIQAELQEIQNELSIASEVEDLIKEVADLSIIANNYKEEISDGEDDICSKLEVIYPVSSIILSGDSDYNELKQELIQNIHYTNESALHKEIQQNKVFFIKALSKESFFTINLVNLLPCRNNELKSYKYICLCDSSNFSVLQLHDIYGSKIKEIRAVQQLYEDPIDEKTAPVQTYTWQLDEKVDFYVKKLLVLDENNKVIAEKTYKDPVLKEGVYEGFYTKPFGATVLDPRDAYKYEYRKNYELERKTTLLVVGSEGEEIRKEVVLKGMEKEIQFKLQHAYSENKIEVKTDLDFDKWYLNGKMITFTPDLVKGRAVIKYGSGLSRGDYAFYLVEDDAKRSETFRVKKDTVNGILVFNLDLSDLTNAEWNVIHIQGAIADSIQSIINYLNTDILVKVVELLDLNMKKVNKDLLKNLKLITSECKDMADIAKELLGTAIPFVKGVCAIVNLVSRKVDAAYSELKSELTKEKIATVKKEIQKLVLKFKNLLDQQLDPDLLQDTVEYYQSLTAGKVTTSVICKDIKNVLGKILKS